MGTTTPGLISFDEPEEGKISFDPNAPSTPENLAAERANKYDFAMGDSSPGRDAIFSGLTGGYEDSIRQHAAGSAEIDRRARASAAVQQIVASRSNKAVSDDDIDALKNMTSSGQDTTPDVIMEKEYGRKYAESVQRNDFVQRAHKEFQDQFDWRIVKYSSATEAIFTRNQIVTRELEDTYEHWKQLPTAFKAAAIVSGMVPYKSWWQIQGAVDGASHSKGWQSLFPGTTMQEQIEHLYMLPSTELKTQLRTTLDRLWDRDASLAMTFAQAVHSYSTSSKFEGNFFGAVDLTAGVAPFLGSMLKGLKPTTTFTQHTTGVPNIRFMTPEELQQVERNVIPMVAGESLEKNAPRTVNSPLIAQHEIDAMDKMPSPINPSPDLGTPTGFTTSRGSTYAIKVDGRTVRDKVPHAGGTTPAELASGTQPISAKTVYLTEQDANRLSPPQGTFRMVDMGDGTISTSTRNEQQGNRWGISPDQKSISYSTTPKEGLVPLELWQPKKIFGYDAYSGVHFGTPITEVQYGRGTQSLPKMLSPNELKKMREGRLPGPALEQIQKNAAEKARPYLELIAAQGQHRALTPAVVAEAVGDIKTAAELQAVDQLKRVVSGNDAFRTSLEYGDQLPGILRGDQVTARMGSFSGEATRKRLNDMMNRNANATISALTDPKNIQRAPDEAILAGFKAQEESLRTGRYATLSDHIMNVHYEWGKDRPDTINFISTHFGKKDGTLFEKESQAQYFANHELRAGQGNYTIENKGAGWYVAVREVMDEGQDAVRDAMITANNKTRRSWANVWFQPTENYGLRSADSVTSQLQRQNAKVATQQTQLIQDYAAQIAAPQAALSRAEKRRLGQVMELDRTERKWRDDVFELEQTYISLHNKPISEREVHAYYANIQLNDLDYLQRNFTYRRDLARQGIENHRFTLRLAETETDPSKVLRSDYVLAKTLDELPFRSGSRSTGMLILDESTGAKSYRRTSTVTEQEYAEINQKIKEDGYKVYQIANPLDRPLKEFAGTGDYVNFVVSKGVKTRPLDFIMIPYNPGGHQEYATNFFVKSAKLSNYGGRRNYEGDVTWFGVETEAEARRLSEAMTKGTKLYREEKWAELDKHLSENLPAEFNMPRFAKYFVGDEARGSLTEPFHAVRSGTSVMDIDKRALEARNPRFHDEFNSEHNLFRNVDKKFLGSRDPELWTVKEDPGAKIASEAALSGTEKNPLYTLDTARMVDPLTMLYKSTAQSLHGRAFNDYKIFALDTWAEDFGHTLEGVSKEALRKNVLHYFMDPKWNFNLSPKELATAQASRTAIKNILSLDSPDVSAVKTLVHKMMSGVYESLGQKSSDWLASSNVVGIMTQSDPFKYARAVAFHPTMGMGSWVQLYNQAWTVVHANAIAGVQHGVPGVFAGTLAAALRWRPDDMNIIKLFDKMLTYTGGWKASEFEEGYTSMRRMGWDRIQGDVIWKNDFKDWSMARGWWNKFLEIGQMPFTGGESISRSTGWMTAYHEWRRANPTAKLTRDVEDRLLDRADKMNMSMTSSSMSSMNQGIVSTPMQYATYQIRLFEQLWDGGHPFTGGNFLTRAEKARVMMTYGAVFGLPTMIGGVVGFWPMYDQIRGMLLDNNIDPDKHPVAKLAMDGMLGSAISLVTGKETDASPKFGASGLKILWDLAHGDKKWYESLWGASGEKIKDITFALDPLATGVYHAMTGQSSKFPIVAEDLKDAFRPINAANTGIRAWEAAMSGKIMTKNKTWVADADMMDAALIGLFGLNKKEVTDTFLKLNKVPSEKEKPGNADQRVTKEIRMSLMAAASNDPEATEAHMTRANYFMDRKDLQPWQRREIFMTVMSGMALSLKDRVNWNYYVRFAPASKVPDNLQYKYGVKPEGSR